MPTPRTLRTRIATALALLGGLALSFASLQSTPAQAASLAHSSPRIAAGSVPEGIFESCDLNAQLATCEQRLDVMSQAGLKVVVIGVGYSTEANLQAYAAYAQSVGMSVMWELNDPGFWGGPWTGSSAAADFSQFAAACGCSDTTGVLNATVGFLASLPGTYGYYAADDLSVTPGDRAGLSAYVSQIKAIDPTHMVLVGANASQGQSSAGSGAVIGNEIYPVTDRNLQNVNANQAAWESVQQQVTQAQTSATRHGQPSAFILQAFTFGDNLADGQAVGACTASMTPQQCYAKLLYPNEQVQALLRNQVLEHSHPGLILWYSFEQTYGQAGSDTYSIYPTGALASSRWSSFTAAINSPPPAPEATTANVRSGAAAHGAHGAHGAGAHRANTVIATHRGPVHRGHGPHRHGGHAGRHHRGHGAGHHSGRRSRHPRHGRSHLSGRSRRPGGRAPHRARQARHVARRRDGAARAR